ncbi:beta-class carbonic anhydrase [Sporolactobacillus pectinivorans]|uniref:beta-class carbonic anhydrase n=1 Tax=Sporolactobacillus pectinivorans TaxID=1591408 RepID=UPI000C263BDC|nr:carbonic anhydrase [Sporolactobacillus pectinivorans]
MSQLEEILAFNKKFVENEAYVPFETSGHPAKKMTIVTCMDCRLIELLPRALNIKNGDAIMIKCAGGMIEDPYSSTMKSILVSLYELGSQAVYVIGHTDCGMYGLDAKNMIEDIKKYGIDDQAFAAVRNQGVSPEKWLNGFHSVDEQVKNSIAVVKNHPFFPGGTPVYGLVIDPKTGELRLVQ